MKPERRQFIRNTLFRHQGGKCCYCGTALVMPKGAVWKGVEANHNRAATFEHLRRKVDGGSNAPDNLALACRACNAARGSLSWVEFKTIRPSQLTRAAS